MSLIDWCVVSCFVLLLFFLTFFLLCFSQFRVGTIIKVNKKVCKQTKQQKQDADGANFYFTNNLSYAQTVLSVAVECVVDKDVQYPFPYPMEYEAQVDWNRNFMLEPYEPAVAFVVLLCTSVLCLHFVCTINIQTP